MARKFATVLLTLALPTIAFAQYGPRYPARPGYGPRPFGPTLSAWVGVGGPGGRISDEGDGELGDVVHHQFPLGLGLSYRFNPFFRAGPFFEAAPLSMADGACAPGDPCGGNDFRFGLDAQVHFAPYRHADPWLGLGIGYEWLNFDATGCLDSGCFAERFHYSGLLFPKLSFGVDFALSPMATLGPYLSYSGGQYSHVETTSAGSQSINDQAFHGWLELGIRGNFNF
ncbi:MAG TPA: hypothetical protein VFG59_04965 [Anaeromyxobacter sp.]|nr:hypothetical protein [Anaeromyxobacter sp.]